MTIGITFAPTLGIPPPVTGRAGTPSATPSPQDAPEASVAPVADHVLVSRVRAGDRAAFGELWSRHAGAARAIAWRYSGIADPEDALQEASRVMLAAILRGGGPFGDFRPYLAVTIRNAAISLSRRRTPEPIGDALEVAEYAAPATHDATSNVLEGMVMARAFKALPSRWQEVLWYVSVEDLSMAEAGAILGLSANAAAALAKRARDGLRVAWLEAHLADGRFEATCRELASDYSAYTRGTLSQDRAAAVTDHLKSCASCTGLITEIRGSAHH